MNSDSDRYEVEPVEPGEPVAETGEREERRRGLAAWWISALIHAAALALLTAIIFVEPGEDVAPVRTAVLAPPSAEDREPPPEAFDEPTEVVVDDSAAAAAEVEALVFDATAIEISEAALDQSVISEVQAVPAHLALGAGATGSGADGGGAFLGGGGGGGSGDGRGVAFFGDPTERTGHLLFIIDMSKSLKEPQEALIKHKLSLAVGDLGKGDRFNVIFFSGPSWLPGTDPQAIRKDWEKGKDHHHYTPLAGLPQASWLRSDPITRNRLAGYLDGLDTSLGTDWRHPFTVAYRMYPRPETIFFLTDGKVNNAEETVALVEQHPGIPVHTIAFGLNDKDGVSALEDMARLTKGTHVAYTMDEIEAMYRELQGLPEEPQRVQ